MGALLLKRIEGKKRGSSKGGPKKRTKGGGTSISGKYPREQANGRTGVRGELRAQAIDVERITYHANYESREGGSCEVYQKGRVIRLKKAEKGVGPYNKWVVGFS